MKSAICLAAGTSQIGRTLISRPSSAIGFYKELNSKNGEPGGSSPRSETLGEHTRRQRSAVSSRDLAENQERCLSLEGSGVRILLTGYKARNSFINAKLQLDV
jgi:hypothetical protein